ncbi:MAG TPA: AAA family ATPase [Methylomirabilota bacterium]|jgi:class 3 adenylate cyclase/tetratricopeptide (TPR) repeat protein
MAEMWEQEMTCPQCGQATPPDANFCPECGTRLAVLCSACSTVNARSHNFCKKCGERLGPPPAVGATSARFTSPDAYTPRRLAEKILTSKTAMEGERKQVTVLFADLKSSMELLAGRDPEEAREILDPMLDHMMEAVHHYEGTVNQVMGDGIMALFGAPLAHEDHALRACYAALRMQAAVKRGAAALERELGVPIRMRVGLNSGQVVVRSIASDLRVDYSAIGQTTHLAGRMEQMAPTGSILMTGETWKLTEGLVKATPLGRQAVKGLAGPVEIYELVGASPVRPRFRATTVRGLTPFVGRTEELARLARARAEAGLGRGQVVSVAGEPGVGKSRLIYEFIESCRRDGWSIAEGRTVSHGKATPYLAVIALLESYFGLDEREDRAAVGEKVADKLRAVDPALLGELSPLLALLDVAVNDPHWHELDPPRRRRLTLDAIKRVLLRESEDRPLVLALEDLQWMDSESEAFLDSLLDSLPTARLLVLVTYRPEYDDRWAKKSYYSLLRVDPLSGETAEGFLEALLGSDAGTRRLKRLLIERTEGNPFFLEESVQTLLETSMLVGEPGAYRLAGEVTEIHVAPTVQAVLASRIDRLAPLDKRLLQSAAVIGKDVPFAVLHAIGAVEEETLRGVLANLQSASFLCETRLFPDLEYTFRHALTHEVAYGSVLLERRRSLHAGIVTAMERLYAGRTSEHAVILAHHAFHGELWDKAVRFLREAAAQAAARSAHQEAVTHLEQAVAALERVPASRDRTEAAVDLRFALRNSLFALGHHGRTLKYLNEAAALAQTLEDEHRLGWVSCYLMVQCLLLGQYERILEHGERALKAGQVLDEVPLQTVANLGLGQAHHAMGRYREALDALERSVAPLRGPLLTERFGMSSPPSVASYTWQAWCHAERGAFTEALASGREALRIADGIKDPWGRAGARFGIGLAHLLQGHVAEAVAALESALDIARAFSLRTWFPPLASALGHARSQAGDRRAGLPLLEDAVEQAAAMELTVRHSMRVCWLGEAYLDEGRLTDAARAAGLALQLASDQGERGSVAWILRLHGDLAAHERRDEDAATSYRRAIALADELEMRPCLARCLLDLGRWHAGAGRPHEARPALLRSVGLFDAMGMASWSKRAADVLDTVA